MGLLGLRVLPEQLVLPYKERLGRVQIDPTSNVWVKCTQHSHAPYSCFYWQLLITVSCCLTSLSSAQHQLRKTRTREKHITRVLISFGKWGYFPHQPQTHVIIPSPTYNRLQIKLLWWCIVKKKHCKTDKLNSLKFKMLRNLCKKFCFSVFSTL